jgi:hypothetical protein
MQKSRGAVILAASAFVMAAVALAVAVYTWWQSGQADEYTVEQQASAKDTACAAYGTVRAGVATNTNLTTSGGDVTGALAAAANARVALIGGGQYVLARLAPATPAELAEPLQKFGDVLMDFGAAATAGALNTDPAQAARLQEIDALNASLQGLCG